MTNPDRSPTAEAFLPPTGRPELPGRRWQSPSFDYAVSRRPSHGPSAWTDRLFFIDSTSPGERNGFALFSARDKKARLAAQRLAGVAPFATALIISPGRSRQDRAPRL